VSEYRGAGPEKFHRRHVVRLPEAVRHNQFHAYCGPVPDALQRQNGGKFGDLPDELKPDDHVDVREFNADVKPGAHLGRGDVRENLRSMPYVFERYVGILLGQFKTNRQDLCARISRFDEPEHQRAILKIFECGRAGRLS
jgi:hypothetical protein